ncbi:MAG: Na+/H+ antiporter subunit E, partial [Campylobacterota bacterium]|nr:Na+/H+ antiporter subunit E [Campylobacterota bacterium]
MRLLFWTVLLFIMWMILTSNFQISNIIIGLGVSFSVALLYLKLFTHKAFEFIRPVWFMVYLYVLLKNLILSNIQIAKRILRPDMKLSPAIVAVKTNLESDWKKLLLANSITLTPGTLTLDIKDDILFIHVIEYHEGSDKGNITKEFED